MRAVVQRSGPARVLVEGLTVSEIQRGLVVFLGVEASDTDADARAMAQKLAGLRIFPNAEGKLDLCVEELAPMAGVLLVPNFTVCGDGSKGRRPDFTRAADRETGSRLWGRVAELLAQRGLAVGCGVFGASMQVEVCNEGPVTIILEIPHRRSFAEDSKGGP